MAKFNQAVSDKITNHEGAEAFKLDNETELYSLVCTSMLEDKFYEGKSAQIIRLRELIKKCRPEFVAKLAVYAREKMYLRSIPLVLVIELAKIHKGDNLVKRATQRVIQRADELTEILAYYQAANPTKETKKLGKLSKQIQKGIAEAFHKFDEYNFAKYNSGKEVKLKDALFLTHPKPQNDAEAALFKKIVDGTLETPLTWEVELSEAGKTGKDKKLVWEEMIDSKKFGYMAVLRNLRNMLEANISTEHIKKVAMKLSDAQEVAKSKQLPFRFLSAYKELKGNTNPHVSIIMDALEEAIKQSVVNLNGYDYDTAVCVACDVSGSMQTNISEKSKIRNYDIGLVLGMCLRNKCKSVITGIFGDTFSIENLPKENILANTDMLDHLSNKVGYSTNGYLVIDRLIKDNVKMDKVMIFTDCQMWDSTYGGRASFNRSWSEYKKLFPGAKLYLFDLAGYGNTPVSMKGNGVYLIAGWSERIFEMLDAIEKGSSATKEIDKIEI